MSTGTIDDMVFLICDKCSEFISSARWESAQEAIKDNGWTTAPGGNLWCWDCAHEESTEVEECD